MAPKKKPKKKPEKPKTWSERCGYVWKDGHLQNRWGRPPRFVDPQDLWERAVEYFKWVEENPIYEQKVFCQGGEIIRAHIPHIRAMTIGGMLVYMGVCVATWHSYQNKEEFVKVVGDIEAVIRAQKFEGAAADMLNSNIIARDLGLSDNLKHTGTLKVDIVDFSDLPDNPDPE